MLPLVRKSFLFRLQCSSDISELCICVLYARILRIRVCLYAYTLCQHARICPFVMHSHKFLYMIMKHCWSNKGHMGTKRLQSEICILLKHHADQWKLSQFKFSITSQIHRPFLWLLLDLKLPNMGRKLKQSLEIPILTRELYVFTRKDLYFGTGPKSFRKNYISGYIWHRSFIQMVKCSFCDAKFVYQSFYDALYTLSYFCLLQGKVLCFARVS